MSRYWIYQLWQCVNICREQLLHTAILKYHSHNLMLSSKALKVLLICAELLCLCHLWLVSNAHLGKEQLANLSARIYIKPRGVGHLTYALFKLTQLHRQRCRVLPKSLTINLHAIPLHIGKYGNHRLLNIVI